MGASEVLAAPAPAGRSAAGAVGIARALMFLSGFAGLGYQIVWTGQCAQWLGHESAALLAVIAAFFGGLALGARALAGRIERSARPGRWYAACEGLIAAWALVLAFGLAPAGGFLLELIGPQPSIAWHWAVAFVGTFLLLLPATVAMGATLPAMERVLASAVPGAQIAGLYAANTAGAVLGVLATAYLLVPAIGLTATALGAALTNGLCALIARVWLDRPRPPGAVAAHQAGRTPWQGLLFATGLLGIGYEVLVVRVLSQVAENTVFTFANLLAVYLVGTALGAALYARWQAGTAQVDEATARTRLFQALAVACLLGLLALSVAPSLRGGLLEGLRPALGGVAAALMAEALLAATAFALPTIAMGALFSHLARASRADGLDLGRALAANTLGAALAPLLVGVLLMPAVGTRAGLLVMIVGYLLLVPRTAWRRPTQGLAVTALAAAALAAPGLQLVDVPPGGRLVDYQEGIAASVSVIEDGREVQTLHINNRQQEGSSVTRYADGRQALLPMLLHGDAPRQVLFLGLGTGVTAAVAATEPTRTVTAVELLPGVIDAARGFRAATGTEAGGAHLNVVQADARRFLRVGSGRYDVIVADNFHPARSGSGLLYTVEHFEAARARLAEGGLFCQWLPLHQLDLDTLRSIVRSYQAAFPRAIAVLATHSLETPVVGLVGRAGDAPLDAAAVHAALSRPGAVDPRDYGFDDVFAVLGMVIADPAALRRFATEAPLNTDDRPVVVYRAPRATYAPEENPAQRVDSLLSQLDAASAEVLANAPAGGDGRLEAYWQARDRFILLGRGVRPSADVRQMLAQVEAPLLAVLQISPDFRPAYDPLLRMAQALAGIDRTAARRLMVALDQRAPARPEARVLLQRLAEMPVGTEVR